MDWAFFSDQELATATLGAIGIHYDLPGEIDYMKSLGAEEAKEYAEEMTDILMVGGFNLIVNLQSLRERSETERLGDEWVELLTALGASLMAGSIFVSPAMQDQFEEAELDQMVLRPEQVEAMLSPELEEMLSGRSVPRVVEDLKASREEYAAQEPV